jgi:hypothetical protein
MRLANRHAAQAPAPRRVNCALAKAHADQAVPPERGDVMRILRYLSFALALAVGIGFAPHAHAYSSYYTSACVECHGSTVTTCNGCHAHGTHSSTTKGALNLAASTSKASYAPGETVTVTLAGGYRNGWVRAVLFDQAGNEIARSSCPGGMGSCSTSVLPATLSAPAPSMAGSYSWAVAWYGNQFDASNASFGTGTSSTIKIGAFTPDPDNAGHGYQTVAVPAFTVTAPSAPAIALNPGTLNLGNVNVGANASLIAQVKNTGSATLTISAIARCTNPATSTEFTWSPTALPISVSPGASANLTVSYAPSAAGSDTGCIALTSNASNGPTTNLAVSGAGVVPSAPKIAVSPTSLPFGNVTLEGTASKTFTISNTGSATLTGTVARASGTSAEYTLSPASFSVAPGASQIVTVTYAPTDTTTDGGSLAVSSNDAASPSVTVTLSGTGVAAPAPNIALSPTSLPFGNVTVGGSASLTTRVQNTGTAPLNVTSIARCASPATSAEFTWSPAGPFAVAAGGSTTVTVTYAPKDAGADAGCIAFSSDDTAKPTVSVDVSGAGQLTAAPKIAVSPSSLSFGNVTAGASSSKKVTLSNTGNATLTGTVARAAGTSGEYAFSPSTFSIAAGASQIVTVTYAPVDLTTDNGSLVVSSNDSTSPSLSVGLSGSGVAAPTPAIALAPGSLAYGTVTLGGSAALTAQVQNTGTATLNVTAIARCSGTSSEFAWTPLAPLSVAPGQSTTVTVTYRPTTAGTDSGCLALSSNDPASPTVNLGLSATAAEQAIPAIALDPASVEFGTVVVGSTVSRTAQVRNTGNAALNVTAISLCSGTPATFTWSPVTGFSVAAGQSAELTVSYAPTAAATDGGCIAVASNDPAHPRVELSVGGVGVQQPVPSADADIDIIDLKIPGRFKCETRPLKPKAVLKNVSAVSGTASARLEGMLDGVLVYENTASVDLAAGAQQEVVFPSYVPPTTSQGSSVAWTLRIADGDPDVDEAAASTVVAYRAGCAVTTGVLGAMNGLYLDSDEEPSATGGCSSGGGGVGFAALLALGLLVARRRVRVAARTRE